MSKKNTKLETIMELREKVNFDILSRMLSAEGLDDKLRSQLKLYYHRRKNDTVPVKYHFSKDLRDFGRLYAENSLSLQSFKREIRHCLSKEYYYDIDMVNCHPRLILQYCKKNNIEHEELENYVNNREKILEKIQRKHLCNRDKAKDLMLRLCYLGKYVIEEENEETGRCEEVEPQSKVREVVRFQKEMKDIASSVCDIEEKTYAMVKKDPTKENKKSSTLSITAQVLEHKCLMAIYDYITKQGYKVGALCFDGLMVEKTKALKKDLSFKNCEKYVKEKTGYEIKLDYKPMDTELSFILPQFSEYVESDRDCQEKLFKIEGSDKFKYCKGDLYVYDEKTGMYSTDETMIYYYLVKNRKYLSIVISMNERTGAENKDNYGDTAKLQKRVIQFVKQASKDDEWLVRTQSSSIGHLLFRDGIYNMNTGVFTKGFNPKIVFHARIGWDFPKYDKNEIKESFKISFGALFKDPKPMIAALAIALAGNTKVKRFYFCPGKTGAGKSGLIKLLELAFGEYIGNFNAESLAHKSSSDNKDEAAKNRWAYLIRSCRIALSNEMNMKKDINANDIKKHSSGGDRIIGRTHNKEEKAFKPHYTLFCMLNDIPKIAPMDDATVNRLTYIEFPYVFVDKKDVDKKDYYKKKDRNLDEKIETESIIRGFIHIILDGYKDYLKNGEPEFDQELKSTWTIDNKHNNEIIELIKEYYDITKNNNDTVEVKDFKKFRESHRKVFSTISAQRFNEILRDDLGLIEGNDKARHWKGIKKIIIKQKEDYPEDIPEDSESED